MAFSGGVDSSLLLKVAKDVLGDKVIAVTAVTPLQPGYERLRAKEVARRLGVKHITIDPKPLNKKAVRDNTRKRCYHCKLALMQQIKRIECAASAQSVDLFHQDHLLGLIEIPHLQHVEIDSAGKLIPDFISTIPGDLISTVYL